MKLIPENEKTFYEARLLASLRGLDENTYREICDILEKLIESHEKYENYLTLLDTSVNHICSYRKEKFGI